MILPLYSTLVGGGCRPNRFFKYPPGQGYCWPNYRGGLFIKRERFGRHTPLRRVYVVNAAAGAMGHV